MNINNQHKEILEVKKEIKFYIKESIKIFTKLMLIPIKCLLLLIVNLINCIASLIILVLVPLSLEGKLIAAIIDIIICKAISKKINTYIEKQLNYHKIYKASENLSIIACNLGNSYRKLKNLKQSSSQQEISTIKTKETTPQKIINLNPKENEQAKYNYHYQTTQTNTKFSESSNNSKKLKLVKSKNNNHNQNNNN